MNRAKTPFRAMIQKADPTHRRFLREAAKIMEAREIDPQGLLARGHGELLRILNERGVKGAAQVARLIPGAITHLATKFPGVGLPITPAAPTHRHALGTPRTEPRQFRCDIVTAWRAVRGRRRDDPRSACAVHTYRVYIRSTREFLAAARRAGIEFDEDSGIEDLTYETVRLAALDQLRNDYATSNVVRIISGVLAVSRDLLPAEHPHIKGLEDQRAAKAVKRDRALPHAMEAQLANLMASDALPRLHALPNIIEASAKEAGCGRKDRIARRQYAVLLGLKIDHFGLSEKQAVGLNIETDIVHLNGKRQLRLWPISAKAKHRFEPMTEESIGRLDRLLQARKQEGLESPLLFPSRRDMFKPRPDVASPEGHPQSKRQPEPGKAVLQGLYSEILKFGNLDMTFLVIRDLFVRVLLEEGVEPFIVARRAGYANVRSMTTRMRAYFRAAGVS
jgi:hypothetical protein